MDFIYHINCFYTLLKELYTAFGNLIVFLPLCMMYFTVYVLYFVNNSGLPISPQHPQEENSWPGQ